MKWLLLCFFIPLISVAQTETVSFIYPDLDQSLISLRLDIASNNIPGVDNSIGNLKKLWTAISTEIEHETVNHIDMCELILEQHDVINRIEKAFAREQFPKALESIDVFYLNMLFLREYGDYAYPLDYLWKAKSKYQELRQAVEDPMMDLRDWFEFQDIIDDFQCVWEEYELLYQDLIPVYFPGFNQEKQQVLHLQMNDCINELISSTKSGFRSDFIIPCDKIEQVIEETLLLYLVEPISDL